MTKDKIITKEQKELEKWKLEYDKPMGKMYRPLLIIIIAVVYLLDALATDIHAGLQDLQYIGFAHKLNTTYDDIASTFAFMNLAPMLINIISPFYKALADKYGRKIMFAISTMGIGAGLLFGVFSDNLLIFWIGRVMLAFFVAADIQLVYIMEISQPDKRARMFAITKFVSFMGVLIVPLCRDLLLNQDGSNWQIVFIPPAIIAVVATLLIILFVRESHPFMKARIAYLETPYDVRVEREKKAKKDKSVSSKKTGIGPGFKYVFRNKSVRSIAIASFCVLLGCFAFIGYSATIWVKGGMDHNLITSALYFFPVSAAIVTLIGGFVSDKWGRKAGSCLFAGLSLVGLTGYVLTATPVLPPWITGAFYGVCYGAFWTTGDILGMLTAESVKTEIRASAQSVLALTGLVAIMISTIGFGIVFDVAGDHFLVISLAWGVITMSAALFVVLTRTRETKGIDINLAGADTV